MYLKALGTWILLVTVSAASCPGQDKARLTEADTDFSFMKKYWGLEIKSFSMNAAGKGTVEFVMLFQFDRDLLGNDVMALRDALAPAVKKIRFVLHDKNNIVFHEFRAFTVEGEITGFQGDAIRLRIVDVAEPLAARASKLIARP